MDILPFYEPQTGTWSYLLVDPGEHAAALVDPVLEFDPVSGLTDTSFVDAILNAADERGARIQWVLETHAHADHLTAADYVRRKHGARVVIGRGIRAVQRTFQRVFDFTDLSTDGRQFDRLVDEGDVIRLGSQEIAVMETPGHTSDSVTYRVADAAFVGDTLFAPNYGTARCDFPGGDAGTLYDSIVRLHALPDDTRLFLCHDYPGEGHQPQCRVTVAESRRSNIHISADTHRDDYVAMRNERDAGLDLPRLILPSVQVNIRAGAPPPPGPNGTAYLRTPFNRSLAELVAGTGPEAD
ncbi:MBL fold metallo-hydrolase [Elongatibacter sediminis]|uniref:MBL fold metallo-hydrolase n=1 Tax=Elongatibacter sediminis TaxID=3119006 RepID=A0AAW9RH03_9GAMM